MQNTKKSHKHQQTEAIRHIVFIALFSALAYAVTFFFSIKVSFLTFDAKDAVITVAAFLFGPVSGVLISLLVATLELITVSTTGFYGFIMNFLSSASFSVVSALIYKHKKTLNGALISLVCAVASLCAVMMGANLLITPFYMGVSISDVAALIPTLLLPFNFSKALVNAALAMLLYKPVSTTLRRSGFMPKAAKSVREQNDTGTEQPLESEDSPTVAPEAKTAYVFNKGTVIILVVAILALALAGVILYSLGAIFA